MKHFLQIHKLLWFSFCYLGNRNLSPHRHCLCYLFFINSKVTAIYALLPACAKLLKPVLLSCLLFLKLCRFTILLWLNSLLFLNWKFIYLCFKLLDILWHNKCFKPCSWRSLIYKVNCLIWKKSVINISLRKLNRRSYSIICNNYIMMFLILRSKPHKYINCLIFCWFFHLNWLKSSF